MARYLARIVRAIIVSVMGAGCGFGLMTFIVFVIYSDQHTAIEMGLTTALVSGLGFGVTIATVLLFTDLTMRLFAAGGHYEEIWELEHSRALELKSTLKEARRFCREALLTVPNLKSVSEDTDAHTMTASIGKSWRSPGESVQIEFSKLNDDNWRLTCSSKCIDPKVHFDYAKNYENVETWSRKMKLLAASQLSAG